MLFVLFFWVILFGIFFVLGDTLNLVFSKLAKKDGAQGLLNIFFLGLAVAAIIACSLSIVAPLNQYLFLAFVLLSMLHCIFHRKRITPYFSSAIATVKNLPVWGKALFFFIAFVVLYHSSSASASFDQFLYHQQHIKWLQEYGVVNGLANLHLRFGFNSSSLSIVSLFAYHPELRISFTALNGLCLFVFCLWLVIRIFKSNNSLTGFIYATTLVVFTHFYAMELSSTSTDIIVNILVAYLILNCLFNQQASKIYLPLAVLPAFCITLKLSSAPIIILSLYYCYHLIIQKEKKVIFILAFLPAIIIIPWLIQNIILTGYLVFPFPHLDLFPFDWKVPYEIVEAEKIRTYEWAKGNSESMMGWIPSWWLQLPPMDKAIYIFAAISIIVSPFVLKRMRSNHFFIIGIITAMAGTIFGFITAPALRFSLGFVLCAAFICFLPLYYKEQTKLKQIPLVIQYVFLGLFIVFHVQYIGKKTIEKIELGSSYVWAQYVKPFPLSYAKGGTQFDQVLIDNVTIYLPKEGEQCFDQELPCTHHVMSNLELRGDDISKGFRIKQ